MTDTKRLEAIAHLKTLSLAKLRQRQDIIHEQIGMAYRQGLMDACDELNEWYLVVSDAIGEKCFKRPFDNRTIKHIN